MAFQSACLDPVTCDTLSQVAAIIRSVASGCEPTPADILTMRMVSQAVTCRAARLTAAGIAAVIGRSSWCDTCATQTQPFFCLCLRLWDCPFASCMRIVLFCIDFKPPLPLLRAAAAAG